mgnify:CR=1 FL=1
MRVFDEYLRRLNIDDNTRVNFDLDTFRSQNQECSEATQDIIKNPQKYYKTIKLHCEKQIQADENFSYGDKKPRVNISFEGTLGSNFVTPRGLGSKFANELVGIQGIITKMDLTKYYLEKSVFWCPATKSFERKDYPDNFALDKEVEPNKNRFIKVNDDNGNPLEF